GGLQVRVDGITTGRRFGGGGSAASAPASTPTPTPSSPAFRVVTPASGTTVVMLLGEPGLYIEAGSLAVLTIRLPPAPVEGVLVEISFAGTVDSLAVQDSGGVMVTDGPTDAFGPGAGLEFRFIEGAWRYWK